MTTSSLVLFKKKNHNLYENPYASWEKNTIVTHSDSLISVFGWVDKSVVTSILPFSSPKCF